MKSLPFLKGERRYTMPDRDIKHYNILVSHKNGKTVRFYELLASESSVNINKLSLRGFWSSHVETKQNGNHIKTA